MVAVATGEGGYTAKSGPERQLEGALRLVAWGPACVPGVVSIVVGSATSYT